MNSTKGIKIAAVCFTLSVAAGGCAVEFEDDIANNQAPMSFEEFEAGVYLEPWEGGVYIVNGDTPVETREELRAFYEDYFTSGELIVHQSGGADVVWNATEKLNITYCVSSKSFGGNYTRVVDAMADATSAWEGAANVNFIHLSAEDGNCTQRNKNVVFDVRQVQSGQYLARAFFPNQNRSSRNVLIDTSTYPYDDDKSDPLSLAGVLRHELGHALGFRHEHTRPESGVCFEDTNWRALTSYDSGSVMHYPQCNGTGNWSLTLTSKDRQGASALYGN
jgi:type IV pilus biogenesis protein CpaD/CtpE